MTTDKSTDRQVTDPAAAVPGTATERELAEQHWATMAHTADLVRKLTTLADRYEAAIVDGSLRAAHSRVRVALMRSTADSGRRLIRALAPPVPLLAEPAAASAATETESAAEVPARRPDADALADRRAAKADRHLAAAPPVLDLDSQARKYALLTRLEERAVVRQAQGVLMARYGLTAAEAFETLLLAATSPTTLDSVAAQVVQQGGLPAAQDAR